MSRFWSSPFSSRGCPGTAPLCAARCPASLVKVVLARYGRPSRAAFPVAGAKADAAGMASYGLSAGLGRSGNQSRTAQLAASFDRCREAHAAFRLGFCDFAVLLFAQPLLPTPSGFAHTGAFPALGDRSEWCYNDYKTEIDFNKTRSLF